MTKPPPLVSCPLPTGNEDADGDPELVAKLPLACKICRDVLRAYVRCFLVTGSHRHNASSFACWA